jgi:hypothetical protein
MTIDNEATALHTGDLCAPRPPADATGDKLKPAATPAPVEQRLPLVIGVTGHRDFQPQARAAIAAAVREVLLHFKTSYPNTPLILLSPLAEGADRLVAEVALESGIGATLMAPLPMAREVYEGDFKTPDSRAEFGRLLDAAAHHLEMPSPPGIGADRLRSEVAARQEQYLAVGEFIARYCQVLIALWDGKAGQRGGTAEVVNLKLTGVPPAGATGSYLPISRGPVYHIRAPRLRESGEDVAVSCTALYPDTENYEPSEAHRFYHYRIFKPLDDYNREVATQGVEDEAAAQGAARELASDQELSSSAPAGANLDAMRRHYATADSLANRYAGSTNRTLYRLSIVAFMAALSFDLAVHILSGERMLALKAICLFGLPILTGVAVLIYRHARRQDYQNRYQDYRGLAEGLRIQFYWRLAGVNECVADHYLGRHRHEMQWIRNACRASLIAANCALGNAGEEVRKIVFDRWIDSQRGYFDRAFQKQRRTLELFGQRIQFCFWIGLLIVLVLGVWTALLAVKHSFHPTALAHVRPAPELLYGALLLAITMTAVLAALTHNYVEKLALETQVRMYQRMRRLYRHYAEILRRARGEDFVRGLFALGREALVENGEWVMHHRERPLEVPHH